MHHIAACTSVCPCVCVPVCVSAHLCVGELLACTRLSVSVDVCLYISTCPHRCPCVRIFQYRCRCVHPGTSILAHVCPPLSVSVDMAPPLSVGIDASIAVQHVCPFQGLCASLCVVSLSLPCTCISESFRGCAPRLVHFWVCTSTCEGVGVHF